MALRVGCDAKFERCQRVAGVLSAVRVAFDKRTSPAVTATADFLAPDILNPDIPKKQRSTARL
jgi:hypothetical protein